VYFTDLSFETGGRTQAGATEEEWRAEIERVHRALALPNEHALSRFVRDVFLPAEPPPTA
jgi:hypothetical protein